MGFLHERAVKGKLAELDSPESRVRLEAAKWLAASGDSRAVDALIAALEGETSAYHGGELVRCLAQLGDPRALGSVLGAVGRRVVIDEQGILRAFAVSADDVLAVLRDGTPEQRAGAARVLGELGDRRAVPLLIEALRGDDDALREGATVALGRLAVEDAFDLLVHRLHNDLSTGVRVEAARALPRIDGERAIEPVVAALQSFGWWDQLDIMLMLRDFEDPRVDAAVRELYRSAREEIQRERLHALLGDRLVTRALATAKVRRGGLDEPYCSEACYERGGATVTTTLLQGWVGVCSVCKQPLEVRLGQQGSMVCSAPGAFLYFHQNDECDRAVAEAVRTSRVCVVRGTSIGD